MRRREGDERKEETRERRNGVHLEVVRARCCFLSIELREELYTRTHVHVHIIHTHASHARAHIHSVAISVSTLASEFNLIFRTRCFWPNNLSEKRKENTKAVFPGKSKDTKTDIHKSQPGPNLSFSLPLCRETHGEEKRRRKGSSALSSAAQRLCERVQRVKEERKQEKRA